MHNYSVLLSMKHLKNPLLLINTQHYSSRSQYAPMEAEEASYEGCLPSCELHMHSRLVTVGRTGKVESS